MSEEESASQTEMCQNGPVRVSGSVASRLGKHTAARGTSVADVTDDAREILELFLRIVEGESTAAGRPRLPSAESPLRNHVSASSDVTTADDIEERNENESFPEKKKKKNKLKSFFSKLKLGRAKHRVRMPRRRIEWPYDGYSIRMESDEGWPTGPSAAVLPDLPHSTSRPFAEKSSCEKHELFEHIAIQLEDISRIADWQFGQADDQPPKSLITEGLLAELVQSTNYDSFQRVLGDIIHKEWSLKQLALWLRVSADAVRIAGQSTTLVTRLKNMTLQYFENNFASWIVNKGGWESIVHDGPATVDSP